MKTITNIFVEIDGEHVNIVDLEKEDYEGFLRKMELLRNVYNLVIAKETQRKK
jgi:hypothetical protein